MTRNIDEAIMGDEEAFHTARFWVKRALQLIPAGSSVFAFPIHGFQQTDTPPEPCAMSSHIVPLKAGYSGSFPNPGLPISLQDGIQWA